MPPAAPAKSPNAKTEITANASWHAQNRKEQTQKVVRTFKKAKQETQKQTPKNTDYLQASNPARQHCH